MPPYKISFDVILKRRITKEDLELTARAIKERNPGYDRVFISYFIAGTRQAETRDDGHWGSSHWEGNKVSLMPGPSEQELLRRRHVRGPAAPKGSKIVGRWFVADDLIGGHIVIYEHNGAFFAHQQYHDGTGKPAHVARQSHKAGTAYREEGTYDYFVVTDSGDLQFWDGAQAVPHEKSERIRQ